MNNTIGMLPLSERHIHEIGYVTALSTLLASMVEGAIWILLGVSREEGLAVTSDVSFANRLHLLKTLGEIKIKDIKVKAEFDSVAADIESANDKRNKIVHATWYYWSPSTQESGALKITARSKLKTSLVGYTPEQIHEIALEIFKASGRLQGLFMNRGKNRPFYAP